MATNNMKEMLDAGVHFGHQTSRWNPSMKPYVYTNRGGIHIIDLQKSVAKARKAAKFIKDMSSKGGRLIFVGTKKQAVEPVVEAAEKCGQYYVTKRWLGGTLTNFSTIKMRIDRLKKIDQMREKGELNFYSKKERGKIEKEYEKLCSFLDGIKDMKEAPSAMFVVDLNKEHIAVKEARRLGIPVVAIADTNTDPNEVDFPIPGNDDAIRSISLFTNLIAESFLEGQKEWEQKIREQSDKQVDKAEEKAAAEGKQEDLSGEGPSVVKVARGRKMVAAGMAEEVEIQMELDEKQDDDTDADTEEN
ncbi:MAG: 30S ribosomal protein S2 [Bdellovibrionales bacterium]|nr:30S ribosomal protein S2 [Bdellovibrionales bacterium]